MTASMNIKVQICGLLIILLFFVFYKRQRPTGLRTAGTFLKLLETTMAGLIFDVISVFLIINGEALSIPTWVVHMFSKLYLISLLWIGYLTLAYTTLEAHETKKRNTFMYIYQGISIVGSILVSFFPIHCVIVDDSCYTEGPACTTTYIVETLLFVTIILHLIIFRKRIPRRNISTVSMIVFIILSAAVIQFLIPEALVVSFAATLGVVVLYIRLENPEANIEPGSGAFTSHILRNYLKQCYNETKDFSILVLNFEQARTDTNAEEKVESLLRPIVEFLHHLADIKVFCHEDRELYLVFRDAETMRNNLPLIKQRFKGEWDLPDFDGETMKISPTYITFADKRLAYNADEVLRLFNYVSAKISNRTTYQELSIDKEMAAERIHFIETEELIKNAIAEDRVEVFYQPIYSTKKKRFTSAEALVRIRKADGSILPPGAFIPVAEETGLVSIIGDIVFEKTCKFLADKEKDVTKYGLEYIEVNLSVYQCEEENLATKFIDTMNSLGLPANRINLEITETGSLRMKDTLLANMRALIDFGITFSLDDFGSGQSNLNYIVDMPVHIVKFDRDMTQSYFDKSNDKGKFVMRAATSMIHDLKLKVVSEGVETAEQLDEMTAQGIDYIQGYYFSKPLPEEQFYEFIRSHANVA